MRSVFLLAFAAVFAAALSAQTSSTFFSTFDAERGNLVVPAGDGNLWLGGQKDERVLLTKLNAEGKVLNRHSIGFEGVGLDLEHLTDLFEETDGTLVGCGNFEEDNLGRSFVFRYNPTTRQIVWAHIVRNGTTSYLLGIIKIGPGGDYVLYGQSRTGTNRDAELLRLDPATGQLVPGKSRRIELGYSERLYQLVYHDGALYACGHFTVGFLPDGYGHTRNALCKLDTATLQPVWSKIGHVSAASLANLQGRDLIVDNNELVSTFSGHTTDPDLPSSTVFLQKNTLDGQLLWVRQYDLPDWSGEFAEEIIALPDGYLLFGNQNVTSDPGHLFLLRTDKDGNVQWTRKIAYDFHDGFPDFPARSKILRLGDALFLTAISQNAVGQTQGILVKTDLNGIVSDSCDYVKPVPVTPIPVSAPVSETVVLVVSSSVATQTAATVSVSLPDLTFSKKCGATGTCPTLPDLRLTLDSIVCTDGDPRLYYTICNIGGQAYDGSAFFMLYPQNPFTDTTKMLIVVIHTSDQPLLPGDCYGKAQISADLHSSTPFELDTFTQLYGLLGVNYTAHPPIPISAFPFPPNHPECDYLNNLDSISVPAQLCGNCENPITFVKKLGEPQRRELAASMCAASDGNLYLAGKQGDNPMIAKITTRGEQLWVRNFPPIHPNEPVEWAQIIEDSEGMLVLCGTEGASPSNRRVIAMRYDPNSGAVLWYKRYTANKPTGSSIVEKAPGGNYVLQNNYQEVQGGGLVSRAGFLEITRADGNPVMEVGYHGQDHNLFLTSMVRNNGNLYAVGAWNLNAGNEGRPFFAKISPTTLWPEWAQTQKPDVSAGKWLTASDIAFDSEFAIIAGTGDDDLTTPTEGVYLFLEKHHSDGSLAWMKRYDIAMAAEEVVTITNAYIVFGRMVGSNRYGMLKTDVNGNVLEARELTAAPPSPISQSSGNRQGLALALPLQLLFLDHTWEANESDIVLTRTDLQLNMDDACDRLKPLTVSSQILSVQSEQASLGIASNIPPSAPALATANFKVDSLPLRKLCPACFCADKPDITCQVDSIYCIPGDGPFANVHICNLGEVAPTTGFYLNFYDKNPLTDTAKVLHQVFFSFKPAPGECFDYPLPLDSALFLYSKIYTLAGIKNNVPTPISLNSFPFPNGFAECDYANNLDSFEVKLPDPVKPALGPDRTICAGQTTMLDAGNGYVSYKWLNGPASRTFTVGTTGNYVVAVTDACGQTLRDTISVTVLPPTPPTTVTIQFYPGDTIIIAGTTYTQSDTVVETLLTATGCDSMVTYFLQRVITTIDLVCPPDQTVSIPANQSSVAVSYPQPAAATDCPIAGITLTRLQGPASGALFPEGTTLVCYEAANRCGIRDTCCFSVKVQKVAEETACDVKIPPGSCIKYELIEIRLDALGRPRYRMRLTNTCASPLRFAYFQIPNGMTAKAPLEGTIYTAPGGNTYLVRNPNAVPYHSIRFKPLSGTLNNGKSDIFEYTLPKQAQMAFILVSAKLEDGSSSEAHVNTFACPVLPYIASVQEPAAQERSTPAATEVFVRPNPTSGALFVEITGKQAQAARLQVLNAQGQLVLERKYISGNTLQLPENLANGLYFLLVQPADGSARAALRFVLER